MSYIPDLRAAIQPRIDADDTDAEILAWLHAKTSPAPVSWTDYMLWLSDTGGAKKLKDAEANVALDDAVRNAASLALIVAQAGQELSLERADVRAALAPLVGVGKPFTAQERDALLAKSDNQIERWRGLGLDKLPKLGHVEAARAL